jgi:nitrogen fixation protein NifX
MGHSPLASREAALRIALAARVLEHTDVRTFVGVLADRLGLPLTEAKLARVTVEGLRDLLGGNPAGEGGAAAPDRRLEAALRIFRGEGLENSDLPAVEPCQDGEMPHSIRVGIASNRGEELDGHFGSCERFLIYQVSAQAMKLIAVRSALDADEGEDKNAARAALVADCQILYLQSIGGPAAAKVVRAGAHPIKHPGGGPAREVLARLQRRIETPPPWLAHVMGIPAASLAKYKEDLAIGEER